MFGVANTFPNQNEAETVVQGDGSCHENVMAEPGFDFNKPMHSPAHSDATQKVESHAGSAENCHEVVCQCCVSGCQSLLSGGSDQNQFSSPVSPEDNYSFVVPKIPSSLLFRPPIIV